MPGAAVWVMVSAALCLSQESDMLQWVLGVHIDAEGKEVIQTLRAQFGQHMHKAFRILLKSYSNERAVMVAAWSFP